MKKIKIVVLFSISMTLFACLSGSGADPRNTEIEGCLVKSEGTPNSLFPSLVHSLVCDDVSYIHLARFYDFTKIILTSAVETEELDLSNFKFVGEVVVEHAKITTLNLGNMPNLYSLQLNSEYVTNVILGGGTALTDLTMQGDVSELLPVGDFLQVSSLTTLAVNSPSIHLADLDLSHMKGLETLDIINADIESIDLSENLALRNVLIDTESVRSIRFSDVDSADNMKLILSGLTSLNELQLINSGLRDLEVNGPVSDVVNINQILSQNTVNRLALSNVPLEFIDFSLSPSLEYVLLRNYASFNNVFDSVLSTTELTLFGNQLPTSVNLANASVTDIELAYSNITDIVLPKNQPVSIDVRAHAVESIKVTGGEFDVRLNVFGSSSQNMIYLDVTELPSLSDLSVSFEGIRELNLTQNTRIRELDLGYLPLENLQMSSVENLTYVQISQTDLSCTQLRPLFSQFNYWWPQIAFNHGC